MTSALNPTGGSWWKLPVTLTQSLVYLGLATGRAAADGVARGPSTGTAGRFWRAPNGRV